MSISTKIDHAFLRPHFTKEEWASYLIQLHSHSFRSACVTPFMATQITLLGYSRCVVFDFPFQQLLPNMRISLVKEMVGEIRFQEIDIVWCDYLFKCGRFMKCLLDLNKIINVLGEIKAKVIVESGYLTPEQLKLAYSIVEDSGAYAIETSTGFLDRGADLDTIKLWKDIGHDLKIKASGGIRDYETAVNFINAGADIIGTSYGHVIVEEEYNAN